MKFIQSVKYIFITILLYLAIAIIELLSIKPLVDGFDLPWFLNLLIDGLFLLIINPIICFLFVDKLPFKPEGLKKENKITIDI